MNAATVEQEINSYLSSLNLKQKKAVLTFVKTVAETEDNSGYSEELKRELDSRYAEYLAGGELLTQEDIDRETEKIINGKRKK